MKRLLLIVLLAFSCSQVTNSTAPEVDASDATPEVDASDAGDFSVDVEPSTPLPTA
jgi:hypothetical protein